MGQHLDLPSTQSVACPRMPVAKCPAKIPTKYIEALEQNQKIASCCRHPENHDIEAMFSSPEDAAKGVPDIYIFHCTCGRMHRRFCIGGNKVNYQTVVRDGLRVTEAVVVEHDHRPFWEIR